MRPSEGGLRAAPRALELPIYPLLVGLAVTLVALLAAGLVIGPVWLSPGTVAAAVLERASPEGLIVGEIRLPRVLLSACVGATLGLAGAALQGLLRNPLAEPGIIGTSGFAALGAVVTLYFGLADAWPWSLPAGGVLGAFVGIVALLLVAGRMASVLTLILAGVALSSLAGACVALALNLSPNPFAALEIAFWLLGSFEDRSQMHLALAVVPMAISWLILLGCGRVLDALTLGEEVARSLGMPLDRARLGVVAGVGLGVGAAVAVSGVIGFVGLVVPHLLRPFVGHRPSALLAPSALGGACLMLAADDLVRVLPTTAELKVGVVTALVGVPFFIMLVIRARRHLI